MKIENGGQFQKKHLYGGYIWLTLKNTKAKARGRVVSSSIAGYFLGCRKINFYSVDFSLAFGGYCMVGASNALLIRLLEQGFGCR